jgi:hypothetical protein
MWQVGSEMAAGTWRNQPGFPDCYAARLRGFSGELKDIIANDNASGQTIVTITGSERGFMSHRCGTWTKIG